jgi:hypothetical protein
MMEVKVGLLVGLGLQHSLMRETKEGVVLGRGGRS